MTNSLSVFSSIRFSRVFAGVLALPQAQRPSLVKLPIEESVVKVLPSTSSTILFVLRTT